ncbi:MAG: hypothetical protein AAGE01_01160 [Pseudomonadota bacterium]
MAVWGLCIAMQALQRRFAPEWSDAMGMDDVMGTKAAEPPRVPDARDREIAELKRRVETLEAIVTDRRYQWEQEFRRAG